MLLVMVPALSVWSTNWAGRAAGLSAVFHAILDPSHGTITFDRSEWLLNGFFSII